MQAAEARQDARQRVYVKDVAHLGQLPRLLLMATHDISKGSELLL
jgi:hypothetical protein